jgi:ABC-type proline/glycine betaine transport system substrate-binding protein
MKKKLFTLGLTLFLCVSFLVGCKEDTDITVKFADVGWDSIKFHNAVAVFIAENAYGYQTEEVSATTPLTVQALKENDMDAIMEMWTDNIASYQEDISSGSYIELGTNFDDNMQGFYIPRYVIEGDSSRNIEATAPELKSVADLVHYKDVFIDEEDASMGRIYGAISGWEIDEIMYNKYKHYGLDKDFNYFHPGSNAALDAAFASAYEKGEPIVGYYWDPTWLTGKYDLVLLEDAPYDPDTYKDGKCACPSVNVTVCVSNDMMKKAPDYVEFLKNYKTSSNLTAEALAYMQDEKADYENTAKWFLLTHDELLAEWLPSKEAELVRKALDK